MALVRSRVLALGSALATLLGALLIALPAAASSKPRAITHGSWWNGPVPAARVQTASAVSGGVVAWGCGSNGIDDSDFGQCAVPPGSTSGVTAVAAGDYHSLALKSGGVLAWGCDGFGLDAGQCTVPPAAASGVIAIAAGDFHSLALTSGGSVLCWGANGSGQCTVPAAAASGVTAIAAGPAFSLALKSNGSVLCWGNNAFGKCTVPPGATSGVIAIAAGQRHSLALKSDGSVLCWGASDPCAVPAAAASGVTAIAGGDIHSLALKSDGSVLCWGNNGFGDCDLPPGVGSGVGAIAASCCHNLALKIRGSALAWGACFGSADGDYGQCTVPGGVDMLAVAAGASHSLAIVDTTPIQLRALEVNQSVQNWRNAVPLVNNKDTGVRAFLQTTPAAGGNQDVAGRLHGTRGGAPLPGSPLAAINSITPAGSVHVEPDIVGARGSLGRSLNFQLPLSWRSGTVQLRFEAVGTTFRCVEPAGVGADPAGDCSVTVTFTPQGRPKIVFVSVPYVDGGSTLAPTEDQLLEQVFRVRSILPTDTITFGLGSLDAFASKPELKDVNSDLELMSVLDTRAGCFPVACHYYGVLVGAGGGEANGIPGQVASGFLGGVGSRTDRGFYRNTAAHELGHVFGRHHAVDDTLGLNAKGEKQGQCGEVASATAPAHTPFETVGGNRRPVLGTLSAGPDEEVWGLDSRFLNDSVLSWDLAVIDPRETFELMSYCQEDPLNEQQGLWISRHTFAGLLGAFANAAGPQRNAVASPSTSGNFVLVRGSVDLLTDQATLKPATAASGIFDVPVSGTYRAQLLDGAANELAGANFAPSEGTEPPPVGLFLVPLPKPAGAPPVARIAILHNGVEIGSTAASANPPSASIVAPTAGQAFNGPTVTFDWNASDPDAGTLSSNVLYSADGGTSWNALAIDHTATELTVDRSALTASPNARLRVVVSDGVHTASADSAAFTVGNNPPEVSILSPPDGHQFSAEQTITLEGSALDREGGSLDASIAWSSNRNGPLGSGSSISVFAGSLTPGMHVITASATDGAGASGTATVTIEVLGGPTAVAVHALQAVESREGIVIRWRTGSEVGLAGFSVYRGRARLNRRLLRARGGLAGARYRYLDARAPHRRPLRYRLQALHVDGSSQWLGPAIKRARGGGG